MARKSYMFTNKEYTPKGIMSAILGILVIVSLGSIIYVTFQSHGEALLRHGLSTLLAAVFALAGLVLGIMARVEKDKYYLFANIGLVTNGIGLFAVGFILYAGVMELV